MLNNNIRTLRKSKSLTQSELASILNVTQQAIGGWESGSREPDIKNIIRLAKLFGVSTDYLLGEENAKSSDVATASAQPITPQERELLEAYHIVMQTPSERLKQIMDAKSLKQSDVLKLAEPYCRKYFVKLGKSDLSQFLSGKVSPGRSKIAILSMALNVSETWLMGLDVPMIRENQETLDYLLGEENAENHPQITPQEMELLAAYHEAPPPIRDAVYGLLAPYKKAHPAADHAAG